MWQQHLDTPTLGMRFLVTAGGVVKCDGVSQTANQYEVGLVVQSYPYTTRIGKTVVKHTPLITPKGQAWIAKKSCGLVWYKLIKKRRRIWVEAVGEILLLVLSIWTTLFERHVN